MFLLTFGLLAALGAAPAAALPDVPTLHTVREVTLSPSYSCRPDSQSGYANTALFLTEHSRKRNSPDLLFNGACGSRDDFEASTAGDDMSLVADLGPDLRIDDLTASMAFNVINVNRDSAYSTFKRLVPVIEGHTYAVLLNNNERRGLFLVQVLDHKPNREVYFRYAVKSYVWQHEQVRAQGFDWGKRSAAAQP